jgi:hypothetical protein
MMQQCLRIIVHMNGFAAEREINMVGHHLSPWIYTNIGLSVFCTVRSDNRSATG